MTFTKERAIEMCGEDDVKQCGKCGGWHSRHSPPLCFACSVGLHPNSKGYHPWI